VVFPSEKLSPADAAVMETFVVPRYLSFFGELALELLNAGEGARIAHLGCRTGDPDRQLFELSSGAPIVGVDASHAALELARNKAAALGGTAIDYQESESLPTELDAGSFSHVLCLHPAGGLESRRELYREMYRLLFTGGQALVALPLRGSFQEVGDLFREYALKNDDGDFGKIVEETMARRHTIETLSEEMEGEGFDDIDVEIRTTMLAFDSGRSFVEDPVCRLLVLPDVRASLDGAELEKPLVYVRDAIDKYWSEGKFELTLNVGCASARRLD
jgi:SAM-dependent methyltransferase